MNHQLVAEALSVDGLTAYIQELLEDDLQLQQVWVTGEVTSLSNHRSGLFFTLSDPQGSAAIRCIVWQSQRQQLVQQPQQGEQIVVLGSMRLYPKRGEYQLNVFQAIAAGAGLQALRTQQLRARLEAEGLFEPQRKRRLPFHPQTIAVVTSPTAAAWGDIQRTLSQRYPGLHLILSPATVQGTQAPAAIATAIERVNHDGRAEVIILARGGGSTEDLSCFNNEQVVRAIATSTIPIITGIGHERDQSLADLVADASVHTPTAAAERVVPQYTQLVVEHQERVQLLLSALQRRLAQETDHLEQLQSRLIRLPTTARSLERALAHCQLLRQKLTALDPHAVLARGYALVQQNQTLVQSTANLALDQEITVQLAQGSLTAKIIEIHE
ncbi:MAG: exodeoxyribonuclease VII large subunit [Cyanophyceae cyanobacterium]